MEHLLKKSKCSIFHNFIIFNYMIFQRRQKALLWSKGFVKILMIRCSKVIIKSYSKLMALLMIEFDHNITCITKKA